jgi:hypothetical protein
MSVAAESPAAGSIDAVRRAAATALATLRTEGFQPDFIASVEQPMRDLLELMSRFAAARQSLLDASGKLTTETQPRLQQAVAQTTQQMADIIAAMRFGQQAAEIETTLYRPPAEVKGADATLDFLRLMEIRSVLRTKPQPEVEQIYRHAIDTENHLLVRAVETDPLRLLVRPEVIEEVQRLRADIANPELARRLHEIRNKQRALNSVVTAARRMMQ